MKETTINIPAETYGMMQVRKDMGYGSISSQIRTICNTYDGHTLKRERHAETKPHKLKLDSQLEHWQVVALLVETTEAQRDELWKGVQDTYNRLAAESLTLEVK
jgi:hypothetical protein